MDGLASILLAFPPDRASTYDEIYDAAAKAHIQRLSQLPSEQSGLLSANANQLLHHVDPALNSISYLVLLRSLLEAHPEAADVSDDLRQAIVVFLLRFDPIQIRYAGSEFSSLLTVVESGTLLPASVAVEVISAALLRLDPTGSMFTSHHLPLVELAYETDNVDSVLPVITKDILFYPGPTTRSDKTLLCDPRLAPTAYMSLGSGFTGKVSSATVLRYDFLCGQCHLLRRDWRAAFDAFERLVTYPAKESGCSKIMLGAYNKWLLVGLLLNGKAPSLPATTSPGAQRMFNLAGNPYAAVAKAFEAGDASSLKAELASGAANADVWREGGDVGLLREVVAHFQRWQILNLRSVYSKIGLEAIRRATQSAETGGPLPSVAEVEALVRDMISSGMLAGEIVVPPGGEDGEPHLVFLRGEKRNGEDDDEEMSEARFAAELAGAVRRVRELQPLVAAQNERLTTHADYIRYLAKEQKRDKNSERDPGVGFDSQVEDEDLMTGVVSNF
ncbi:hypothetical protein VTK73DRAFT_7298 [Phialemonium thermophilum]|uniref:COP9 signalosome complex subunit 3 N-terminal helical repeats domain-containing protein n=1 Tax=Phialemonium thermophilum TaxID=223376 RepID=A0ABR3WF36_9PEZI